MSGFIGVILSGLVLIVYLLVVKWFFQFAALYVFFIASVLVSGLILVNYARAVADSLKNRLPASQKAFPVPPEPAYKGFFFRRAYYDYFDIVIQAWKYNAAHGKILLRYIVKFVKNPAWFITWPISVTLAAVFLVAVIVSAVVFVLFGLLHILVLCFATGLAVLGASYMRLVELLAGAWRRISYVCPHPDCYRHISVPVFQCPTCARPHRKLVPGSYGVFKRRCRCNTILPTSPWLGRGKLDSYCPYCDRSLNPAIGSATNIHLPIIGGPSSGKSSYLMASMLTLESMSGFSRQQISLPEREDRQRFEHNKLLFEAGESLAKTAELSPKSFLVNLSRGGEKHLLYIYDAAGELYADAADIRRLHRYFAYADGLLLLVDPFSIPSVRANYRQQLGIFGAQLKPATETPQDVYDRLLNTLRGFNPAKRKLQNCPLAIVVTKSDAFNLQNEFSTERESDPNTTVRDWLLRNGEGNFVRKIEQDFNDVAYFSCSALGRLPDGVSPFKPADVQKPIEYLLGARDISFNKPAWPSLSLRSERVSYAFAMLFAALLFVGSSLLVGRGVAAAVPEGSAELLSEQMKAFTEFAKRATPLVETPTERFTTQEEVRMHADADLDSRAIHLIPTGKELAPIDKKIVDETLWYYVVVDDNHQGWIVAGEYLGQAR